MPNPRLLVVDDNADTLHLFETFLSFAGFDVVAANGAADALARANQGVDVVATDLAMPGIDGFELIRRLRAFCAAHQIPIVAVTGQPFDVPRLARDEIGACRLVHKPCDLADLANTLHALVRQCPHDCERCPHRSSP